MIRKYRESEIPELIIVWEKAVAIAHPFLTDEFNAQVKKAMIEVYLPGSDTWVYEKSGKAVGFISMLKNEIGGFFIHPKYHGKGIGTSMIQYISQFHEVLEVEVFAENRIGRPFYEKYGFEVIQEFIHEGTGQKVLRMRKNKT
ncbi:MAG: GNAT family N-acetyltransferase [Cyclobacteriaceae bacterium]